VYVPASRPGLSGDMWPAPGEVGESSVW